MKRFALLLLLGFWLALPAHAQFSKIISIRLINNNNTVAQTFQSNFSLKVGTHCTWNVTGTVAIMDCSGGGATPASPSGSIQYNNAGSFGAIAEWANGKADCDTFMDPCDVFITQTGTFAYFMGGTNTAAPAGNNWNCADESDGGVYCFATDGTDTGEMAFAPGSGNTGMLTVHSAKNTGFAINSTDRDIKSSRLLFGNQFNTGVTAMAFTLSSGWGSTASVTTQGGNDNNFYFQITTGGTGIAANPTVTYTYVDGDFDTSSVTIPGYICSQTGGNDIYAVPSNTPGQTSTVITWHGTPTTAKTYTISCVGFERS